MTKRRMCKNICRKFGLENDIAINFCEACEKKKYNRKDIKTIYKILMV